MEDMEQIATRLKIGINDPLPDLSAPNTIRRMAEDFTLQCLEELEAGDRAEIESRAGMRNVWIPG